MIYKPSSAFSSPLNRAARVSKRPLPHGRDFAGKSEIRNQKSEIRNPPPALQKRTNILPNPLPHLDVESGFGRDFEDLPRPVAVRGRLAIDFDTALAGDDFHPLRLVGSEVKLAGVNQSQGFLRAIGKKQGVADNFALKVNVGF